VHTLIRNIVTIVPLRKDCPVMKQRRRVISFKYQRRPCTALYLSPRWEPPNIKSWPKKEPVLRGIPSVLRRRYKIDHLPVRGLIREKVYLGFKISAINCKRLIKGLMNRSKEGLPALLYNHLFSLFSFQRTYQVKFAA